MVEGEIQDKLTLKSVLLVVAYGILAVGLTSFALFGLRALESELFKERAFFYYPFGTIGLLMIIGLAIGQRIVEKNPGKYAKTWGWMFAPFHSPKLSPIADIPIINKLTKFSNLFFFGLILFTIVGVFGVITNTFFAPIPQQIAEAGEFIFSVYPASPSETLFFSAIAFLLWGVLRWIILYRNKGSKGLAIALSFLLIPPLIGLIRVGYHLLAYSGSETSLIAVFIFGYLNVIFLMLFYSILLWWLWHDINNMLSGANTLFANDIAIITVVGVIFLIIFIIIIINYISKKRRK